MSCSLNKKPLNDFALQHEQSRWFSGNLSMRIHTLHYPQQTERCVLVVPGRAEVAYKYREVAYDLWQRGYAVAVIDHRGQGMSQRFFADMQLGHMDDFEHAAGDLLLFAQQLKQCYCKLFLLAHSMGGAISCRALQQTSNLFESAVISCPMLSLDSGSIPNGLMTKVTAPMAVVNRFCWWMARRKPRFISKDRREVKIDAFAGNRVTSSPERHAFIQKQLIENSDYAVGGPTAQWVKAAFQMMDRIQNRAMWITTPLLILQGGKDEVVTPNGQNNLAKNLKKTLAKKSALIRYSDGLHELLMETDSIRNAVLDQIIEWFAHK